MTAPRAIQADHSYSITEVEYEGRLGVKAYSANGDWIAAARGTHSGQWFVMLGCDAAKAAGYDSVMDSPWLEADTYAEARSAVEMFARLYFAQPRETGTPQ